MAAAMDIFSLIGFLGAGQGLFVAALFIWGPKQLRRSNRYLAILLLLLSIILTDQASSGTAIQPSIISYLF